MSTQDKEKTVNIRLTWDKFIAPVTTISLEDAIKEIHPTLDWTPKQTLEALTKIAEAHAR